jgi:hypothetical protein
MPPCFVGVDIANQAPDAKPNHDCERAKCDGLAKPSTWRADCAQPISKVLLAANTSGASGSITQKLRMRIAFSSLHQRDKQARQ